jgi:hypothetical protein
MRPARLGMHRRDEPRDEVREVWVVSRTLHLNMGFVGNHGGRKVERRSPGSEHWQDVREDLADYQRSAAGGRDRCFGLEVGAAVEGDPHLAFGRHRHRPQVCLAGASSRCGREAGRAWHRPPSAARRRLLPLPRRSGSRTHRSSAAKFPRCRSASATRSNRSASSTSSARLRCAMSGDVSQAKESSSGLSYQSAFAEATNGSAPRAESRRSCVPVRLEVGQHGALDQLPQRIPVVEQRRGDERLAVNESEASSSRRTTWDGTRSGAASWTACSRCASGPSKPRRGSIRSSNSAANTGVRGVDRVEPPPGRCEVDHADVVEICREQTVGDQEREPLRRAPVKSAGRSPFSARSW